VDFALTPRQQELQRAARALLAGACTVEQLQAAESSADGFSRETYRALAQRGWLELGVRGLERAPETFLDLVVLYEEFGRAALPGPHFVSTILGGWLLGRWGGEAHRSRLDALAGGEQIATVAVYEEEAGYDAGSVHLSARFDGSAAVLSGRKLFVPFASTADVLVVLARTGPAPEQLTFFVVPSATPGLALTPLRTMSGEPQFDVEFHHVRVGRDVSLGALDSGWVAWQSILPAATVLQAVELVGLADTALDMAVEYAKRRVAFGRPIGSFQAIQHLCAEMVSDRDAARFLTYQAACLIAAGEPARPEVAMAKAFAAAAARRVTKGAHQVYAAAGYVLTNRLSFYYRRAKAVELALGDVGEQLAIVADRLGL
jgi:alkylation response protein AidB-like acyl-CoA dehydrogenase